MVYPSSGMQSDGDSGLVDLEAQLASKEREWKELLAARVHQLESSLKKAQEECSSLRERFQQLREDFQFNLAILDEQDRELKRYDVKTARALTVEHNRQGELNQLRMQVAKLEKQKAKESEERQELTMRLDALKCSMAGEIQKQTEEYDRMKWDLQCRIQDMERELVLQRQEMTAAFDSELRQREHEYNLKIDEMRAVVLSQDLKVKLLSKETEFHCQAQHQATEVLESSREFFQEIQNQLQHKDQEIKDLTAAKDYKIKELEDELKWMETKLKKEEDGNIKNIKKFEDVVRALKRCDGQLEAQYQAHTEQLQKAERHIVRLQGNVEVLAARLCCIKEDQQEAMKQKDETIQRLRTEIEATQTGWEKHISQVFSEMVVKDTEMITLRERETKLRTERERSREQMERYKQQLSAGLERERALEQMQVQVELEWQRRFEDMKAQHYMANVQLMQDLTQARDQAKAQLKEKEQDLQDLTVLLHSVKTERDQAAQGLSPKVDSLASEEIRCLQQQNSILRAVVTQMRKDIEGLVHLLPCSQAQPVQHPGAPAATSITPYCSHSHSPAQSISLKVSPAAYTLDQEVSPLEARFRHLEGQLDKTTDKPTEDLAALVPDNTHLQRLKQGGLCLERRANSSALAKQEVRVAHPQSALANLMEQSALVQQLQEENLYLRQQQASGLKSGGLSENVQGAKSNPPVLHTRLKRAASCIARLSREKQQLIEMGNCLRAQITTVGLQEPVEPERDSSTEKQGDQHVRLFALEQLQHQLTTQELQYALRQRACTVAEQLPPGTSNQDPATNGVANPWSQGHKINDRPESSKNKENMLSQSQSSMDVGLQPNSRLSSEESQRSLKELWNILDHGFSSSIFSEGEGELSTREVAKSDGAGVQTMVRGISAPIHSQLQTETQQRRNSSKTPANTTSTSTPGPAGRIRKIRNYNVKD